MRHIDSRNLKGLSWRYLSPIKANKIPPEIVKKRRSVFVRELRLTVYLGKGMTIKKWITNHYASGSMSTGMFERLKNKY